MERIFHTVGQGAFYSERHDNFNIVYDCGTEWKNRTNKVIDKTIKQSFSKHDVIDILFISHFDYDHVSKIKTLKEHVSGIRKVVMPLLHNEEKYLLVNIYRGLGFHILNLISNPEKFFGQETKIITVTEAENIEIPINDDKVNEDIDSITTNSIASGTMLRKSFTGYNWIFIPYNHKYTERNTGLIETLKDNGFKDEQIKCLKTDLKYTLDKITTDLNISKAKGGKIFREIYDSLDGKINENSMLLFSGTEDLLIRDSYPYNYSKRYFGDYDEWMRRVRRKDYMYKVSCIYTGDTNLNVVKIKHIFKYYWNTVGTIQIPHHGDLSSFDKGILSDKYYMCPISVGEKNSYGHPSSKVIADILGHRSCPILITENLTSVFIEHCF